jgi:hypothetical protein
MADLLAEHHEAVHRLAEVPGLGVDSAQQIIAEVGHRRDASLTETPRVVDGSVSRHRGERGQELQSPLSQGQPADGTRPESGGKRYGEGEGHHLRDRVSPARAAPWSRPNHRCDHPPTLSPHLEDSSPGRAVRGTRAGGQRRGKEGPSAQDDPRTAKPRLSRRTAPGSIEQPA